MLTNLSSAKSSAPIAELLGRHSRHGVVGADGAPLLHDLTRRIQTRDALEPIRDRDASFTTAFDEVFRAAGTRIVRSAIQAPRMNSVMERWIGSCRRELLDRTLV